MADKSISDDEVREIFRRFCDIEPIKNNDPGLSDFCIHSFDWRLSEVPSAAWERLGGYVSRNEHLREFELISCGLNDTKASAFFRGLNNGGGSLRELDLANNTFGGDAIRSMTSFLRRSPNLTELSFTQNEGIGSEGFDLLLHSMMGMRNVEGLNVGSCGINSLAALDRHTLPPTLRGLYLANNSITDIPTQALAHHTQLEKLYLNYNNKLGEGGFLALANLLRRKECSLKDLRIRSTGMNDRHVKIIVDSLGSNTMLEALDVTENEIGPGGLVSFLKLLNDVSSMDRAGNSNCMLKYLHISASESHPNACKKSEEVSQCIKDALAINRGHKAPHAAGRDKVLRLLNRSKRLMLSHLQGAEHSSDHHVFSDIDQVFLPDILGTMAKTHYHDGQLYQMLLVVAPDLVSLIDRKAMLEENVANNKARIAKLESATARMEMQLTTIEAERAGASPLSGTKRGRDTAA